MATTHNDTTDRNGNKVQNDQNANRQNETQEARTAREQAEARDKAHNPNPVR